MNSNGTTIVAEEAGYNGDCTGYIYVSRSGDC